MRGAKGRDCCERFLPKGTKRGEKGERDSDVDSDADWRGGTELGPACVEGVLVLLLVLGPMGELGRRRRRCSGSSTSTALRAEYECEYDRGRIGS